ncbi:MAG: hypothetical protein WBW51_07485 [Methyloceanibacter sp.]
MARTRSTFCCPNCFNRFQKDDSILMLSSGAAVSGKGVSWSGRLDRDIDRIKRVKYCKRCRQPLDFHALLRGKLDYHAWGPLWSVLAFLLVLAASWFWLDNSFWASLGLAALAATAAGFAGSRLERKRLARWRLNERELAKLTVS